ncbi:glutathione S-transferase family protein [Kiloniella laminariae]|uniref:Glutathione S-transferase family protein n=1 Tax=Kiloniella laminariae TaxID=454162 RepID=A0ABT4LKC4_9PROT|nr:glutathione S-transferase family protein [Kiloniella laminariae]MCZ4281546.1 glutathione S-transferase family protein [Kiloniella laminariae]
MRTLYHLPLDPGCRKVRMLLREKQLECELHAEKIWERRDEFLKLNPAGEVPVLVEEDGTTITGGAQVVAEYLEEAYPENPLLGDGPLCRAEVRRLIAWFDLKFWREVTANLVEEKMLKRFLGLGQPNSSAIRAGHANIHYHLEYIGWLSDRRNWLAGEDFSLADITAASHISALDYIGDVPWQMHPGAKDWYARVKSRPCMRGVLGDTIAGAPPVKHYADLDF